MEGQVPPELASERSAEVRELAAAMRRRCLEARVGCEELILVQRGGLGVTGGLFDALIDGGEEGALIRARVSGVSGQGLLDCRQSEL